MALDETAVGSSGGVGRWQTPAPLPDGAAIMSRGALIYGSDPTGRGRERWSNRWNGALAAFDAAFQGRLTARRTQPKPRSSRSSTSN
ncbi:hypothetical protein [Kitasatospora sp. HPMI-4]|uniref:hypothetical protein n=1 Tax=Kitasatospora sp. HPMI-4 TaxID=3448443 RepID=UPI003F1C06A2